MLSITSVDQGAWVAGVAVVTSCDIHGAAHSKRNNTYLQHSGAGGTVVRSSEGIATGLDARDNSTQHSLQYAVAEGCATWPHARSHPPISFPAARGQQCALSQAYLRTPRAGL